MEYMDHVDYSAEYQAAERQDARYEREMAIAAMSYEELEAACEAEAASNYVVMPAGLQAWEEFVNATPNLHLRRQRAQHIIQHSCPCGSGQIKAQCAHPDDADIVW